MKSRDPFSSQFLMQAEDRCPRRANNYPGIVQTTPLILYTEVFMANNQTTNVHIRIAWTDDLARIIEIYNQAIASKSSTADLSPLRLEDQQSWFAEHNPEKYPIFLAEVEDTIAGWCSLSPYRPGRMALRFTAEISIYVDHGFHRRGVATGLINHAIAECPGLEIKTLFGILLERNIASRQMMEKMGFQRWGFLPRVADFGGEECGHLYYGKRIWDAGDETVGSHSHNKKV